MPERGVWLAGLPAERWALPWGESRTDAPAAVCLAIGTGVAQAQSAAPRSLDVLTGRWTIVDARGAAVGESTVEVQVPDAMLFEVRRVGTGKPQALWFANLEAGGWMQLFVGARGSVREFRTQSAPGAWPVVMGAAFITQDGQVTTYRMTISRAPDDETRRVLESSRDAGTAWTTVFDYGYRRARD